MFSRCRFIQTASIAAFGIAARAQTATPLPPVRAITRGPQKHWFGYYDKFQFDVTSRLVLGNQVDFEHRSPRSNDRINLGYVDLQDNDRWTEIGSTLAWNWQQGCMLQWLPGSAGEVMWNDREGDAFICRILDVKARRQTHSPPVGVHRQPGRTLGPEPGFQEIE